jgi:uncharacterized repeat protein (TIGR03803 family)
MNRLLLCSLSAAFLSAAICHAENSHLSKETVVYSFQNNGMDGMAPEASLISVNSALYGTTVSGGANDAGTVFSVDPKTGAEAIVYSFQNNGADGNSPVAPVTNVKGILYGNTQVGGAGSCEGGCGTVYSVDPTDGTEKVVYSFCSQQGCADGDLPTGQLIEQKGALYGITVEGGQQNQDCPEAGCGIVFSVDPATGVEAELYAFCSQQNCADGYSPSGGLLNVGGMLYGVAQGGGANNKGALYAIDPASGTEKVVYSYSTDGTDGGPPYGPLIDVNGTLYGTTNNSGAHNGGAIVAFDLKKGSASVVYSFCSKKNCKDGWMPFDGVIGANGALYGTTLWGGNPGCENDSCGVVFSVNPQSGTEKVLYTFCGKANCADGASPAGGLIYYDKKLYGTTEQGGTGTCNQYLIACGTVFSVKP